MVGVILSHPFMFIHEGREEAAEAVSSSSHLPPSAFFRTREMVERQNMAEIVQPTICA